MQRLFPSFCRKTCAALPSSSQLTKNMFPVRVVRGFASSQPPTAFPDGKAMYSDILERTSIGKPVRNYVGTVSDMSPSSFTIETDLFPADVLEFYSAHNLGLLSQDDARYERFYDAARGGGQGDYRSHIGAKMDNVVSALQQFPHSKRAVLTVPFADYGSGQIDHTNDEEAKCLRELHFYIEDDTLHCTGFMRAQAATIFPKNIHYIGSVIQLIASRLNKKPGSYTHLVTTLVNERSA